MQFQAKVTHKPGSLRLDSYPLLVHAPAQHGPGVRTEDHGLCVDTIAAAIAEGGSPESVAEQLGTTAGHVHQALSYASKFPQV